MTREHLRQAILGLVGLVFVGLVYPLASDLWHAKWLVQMKDNECEPMFLSFFVVLGLFLLLAVRRPPEHRSLIAQNPEAHVALANLDFNYFWEFQRSGRG